MSDITFVTPRYGADVVGGAELGARALATRLSADGLDIAVLTSRARSFDTWADDYPEGTTIEEGVSVSRFSVDHPRSPDFAASCARLLAHPEQASMQDAWRWIDEQGPTSNDLLEAIAEVDCGVLSLTPYMYHPAVRGVTVGPASPLCCTRLLIRSHRWGFPSSTSCSIPCRLLRTTAVSNSDWSWIAFRLRF